MSRTHLVVVGDAFLDVDVEGTSERLCPDAPAPVVDVAVDRYRPGGAGLAALLAAHDGIRVTLVSALAHDDRGRLLTGALADAGVDVVALDGASSTVEKARVLVAGRPVVRLDRGAARPAHPLLNDAAERAITEGDAVLVSDYGRGISASSTVRAALARAGRELPVAWDPHPRGAPPLPGVHLVTPNRSEMVTFTGAAEPATFGGVAVAASRLRARWAARAVAVTLGGEGAVVVMDGAQNPLVVPARPLPAVDPCGAGDRFASAAAAAMAGGATAPEAVQHAVPTATAWLAAGGVDSLHPPPTDGTVQEPAAVYDGHRSGWAPWDHAVQTAEEARARGGVVVAAGGCFDLLHAGHVQLLQQARSLGSCLIVCCNTDRSIRRLKGRGRPVVSEADRVALLHALECVDAVALFDGPTPIEPLEQIRPDLFVKGAEYLEEPLPESAVLGQWGGHVVTLPCLAGRSTTRFVEELRSASLS